MCDIITSSWRPLLAVWSAVQPNALVKFHHSPIFQTNQPWIRKLCEPLLMGHIITRFMDTNAHSHVWFIGRHLAGKLDSTILMRIGQLCHSPIFPILVCEMQRHSYITDFVHSSLSNNMPKSRHRGCRGMPKQQRRLRLLGTAHKPYNHQIYEDSC